MFACTIYSLRFYFSKHKISSYGTNILARTLNRDNLKEKGKIGTGILPFSNEIEKIIRSPLQMIKLTFYVFDIIHYENINTKIPWVFWLFFSTVYINVKFIIIHLISINIIANHIKQMWSTTHVEYFITRAKTFCDDWKIGNLIM